MAVVQLARGAFVAPWPQATWVSVIRRSLVTAGFLAGGLITGELDLWVFGAFGALQLGLGEAALPFWRLLRLIGLTIAAMGAVAFLGATLAGSWWTVLLLGAVAFLHGSSVTVGALPRTVGIGALAMGVIFAGLGGIDPGPATAWLMIGACSQGLLWLILWSVERDRAVRLVLANSVRSVARIARSDDVTGRASSLASAEVDEARSTIVSAGVRYRESAFRVADLVDEVRRTTVAWQVLHRPGYGSRLSVFQRLRHSVGLLREGPVPPSTGPAPEGSWAVSRHLADRIEALDEAIDHLHDPDPASPPLPPPARWREWGGLTPGTPEFRHGVRMSLAIMIAQAVSLFVPTEHTFWIPLTCVFVVKPDWSFTVIRSVARVIGNLLAVLLVPFVLGAVLGYPVLVVLLVIVISAIAFRFFTGNYILSSFGIAGTILVLDQTLQPAPYLYDLRFIFTVVGAVIGIAVSALIPARRGRSATELLGGVASGLEAWTRQVCGGLLAPETFDFADSRQAAERERGHLIRLRPAVEAALLEPGDSADARVLAVALDTAGRAHLALLALTFEAQRMQRQGIPGLAVTSDAEVAQEALITAAEALGEDVADRSPLQAGGTLRVPADDEERAAALEVVRLRDAAVDIRNCAQWLGTPSRPGP